MNEVKTNPAAENEYLLEVNNLVKWFPIKSSFFKRTVGNVKAVDGVSFKIRRGETMGLVGESGCGKSTCGRTILRLQEKTAGEVLLNGQDIFALSKEELRKLRPCAARSVRRLHYPRDGGLRSAGVLQGPLPA